MISVRFQRCLLPIALPLLWEVLARSGLLPAYLSMPTKVIAALIETARDGELISAILISGYRAVIGFVLGATSGIFLGLLAGLLKPVRDFFDPLVSFLYPVPKIAFLPIFLLIFGLGDASKIAVIAFSGFFPVFIASRHSILSIQKQIIWAAQNMGAPKWTLFFRVYLPASAPELFAGLRIGLAFTFVILFAAELLGSQGGLSTLVIEGEEAARFDLMLAAIMMFAVIGFVSDRILMAIRKRVLHGQMIGTMEQVLR